MRNFLLLTTFTVLAFLGHSVPGFGKDNLKELELYTTPYELKVIPYLEMFRDTDNAVSFDSIQQLQSNFLPFVEDSIPAGTSHWWLKFDIHNKSEEVQELLLGSSEYDYVDFYVPNQDGTYRVVKSGSLFPNEDKPFVYRANSYAGINLAPAQQATCYMKVSYINKPAFKFETIPFKLNISSRKQVFADKEHRDTLLLILTGGAFIMLIYNIFLFLMVRDNGYLYYALLTALVYSFAFMLSGKLIELTENADNFESLLRYGGTASFIGYLLFSRKVMSLKEKHPKSFLYSSGVLVLLAVDFPLTYFNLLAIALPISTIAAMGTYGIALTSAVRLSFKDNYLPAKYFLLGNSFNALFAIIAILQMLTILPVTFMGLKASSFFMIGVMIELALFSLSLGARINEVKAEVAQKELENERLLREEEAKRNALIQKQNEELEQKVDERTYELQERNEEIEQQNEELASQADALMKANYMLDSQNQKIISSLNYAKRIQQAMLPEQHDIENEQRFVFFRPQSVVSGDFYYYYRQDHLEVIAAVDCTGHGVPGAFMSLIGNHLLTECIELRQIFSPDQILEYLHQGVRKTLKQGDTNNRDGMDMALVVIDHKRKVMEYAGAKNPLFYFQNGEAHLIKGNKSAIGGKELYKGSEGFVKHEISLEQPIHYFLYSDGFQDQFGGPKKRKYMSKRFRKLLEENHKLPAIEQKFILDKELEGWKKDQSQTDDILVIGGYIA